MCGILAGYLGGAAWIEQVGGWRNMYGAAAIPAVALGIGMVRLNLFVVALWRTATAASPAPAACNDEAQLQILLTHLRNIT